jgi:VIT1/CCC1 family predicted Fe2+/Mn2+ transporter
MSELDGQFETTVAMHDEKHIQVGEYLKSFIYGGLDGTVNTLTIIAGGVAATQQPTKIMKIGLSAMIGDGLGMGLSDYLSAKAEKQFILSEEKRELWEVNNRLEDEKSEVVCIYEANNYT